MKKKRKHGKTVKNKQALNQRLITYSLAAGTTLTLASPVNAAIRYSGIKNQTVDNTVFQLDMQDVLDGKGDGIPDFSFVNYDYDYTYATTITTTTSGKRFAGSYFYKVHLDMMAPANAGNAFVADETKYFVVANLEKWERIGPGAKNFTSTTGLLDKYYDIAFKGVNTSDPSETTSASYKFSYGKFVGKKGYIGVRFLISGKTHYGWVRFDATTKRAPVTIVDWAYEDEPEKAIAAGDTGQTPIPALNQWGMMFLAGLILLEGARRLRKARHGEEDET